MIEIENPSKRYGEKLAADRLDFVVQPGIVTGFLGPNGAGKSTTMPAALQRLPTAGCGGMSTPAVVRSRCWCIRVNAGSARNTTTRLSSGSGHHLPCHPRSFHDGVETDHHGTTTTSTAASSAGDSAGEEQGLAPGPDRPRRTVGPPGGRVWTPDGARHRSHGMCPGPEYPCSAVHHRGGAGFTPDSGPWANVRGPLYWPFGRSRPDLRVPTPGGRSSVPREAL